MLQACSDESKASVNACQTREGRELSSDSQAQNNPLKAMSDTEIRKLSLYK